MAYFSEHVYGFMQTLEPSGLGEFIHQGTPVSFAESPIRDFIGCTGYRLLNNGSAYPVIRAIHFDLGEIPLERAWAISYQWATNNCTPAGPTVCTLLQRLPHKAPHVSATIVAKAFVSNERGHWFLHQLRKKHPLFSGGLAAAYIASYGYLMLDVAFTVGVTYFGSNTGWFQDLYVHNSETSLESLTHPLWNTQVTYDLPAPFFWTEFFPVSQADMSVRISDAKWANLLAYFMTDPVQRIAARMLLCPQDSPWSLTPEGWEVEEGTIWTFVHRSTAQELNVWPPLLLYLSTTARAEYVAGLMDAAVYDVLDRHISTDFLPLTKDPAIDAFKDRCLLQIQESCMRTSIRITTTSVEDIWSRMVVSNPDETFLAWVYFMCTTFRSMYEVAPTTNDTFTYDPWTRYNWSSPTATLPPFTCPATVITNIDGWAWDKAKPLFTLYMAYLQNISNAFYVKLAHTPLHFKPILYDYYVENPNCKHTSPILVLFALTIADLQVRAGIPPDEDVDRGEYLFTVHFALGMGNVDVLQDLVSGPKYKDEAYDIFPNGANAGVVTEDSKYNMYGSPMYLKTTTDDNLIVDEVVAQFPIVVMWRIAESVISMIKSTTPDADVVRHEPLRVLSVYYEQMYNYILAEDTLMDVFMSMEPWFTLGGDIYTLVEGVAESHLTRMVKQLSIYASTWRDKATLLANISSLGRPIAQTNKGKGSKASETVLTIDLTDKKYRRLDNADYPLTPYTLFANYDIQYANPVQPKVGLRYLFRQRRREYTFKVLREISSHKPTSPQVLKRMQMWFKRRFQRIPPVGRTSNTMDMLRYSTELLKVPKPILARCCYKLADVDSKLVYDNTLDVDASTAATLYLTIAGYVAHTDIITCDATSRSDLTMLYDYGHSYTLYHLLNRNSLFHVFMAKHTQSYSTTWKYAMLTDACLSLSATMATRWTSEDAGVSVSTEVLTRLLDGIRNHAFVHTYFPTERVSTAWTTISSQVNVTCDTFRTAYDTTEDEAFENAMFAVGGQIGQTAATVGSIIRSATFITNIPGNASKILLPWVHLTLNDVATLVTMDPLLPCGLATLTTRIVNELPDRFLMTLRAPGDVQLDIPVPHVVVAMDVCEGVRQLGYIDGIPISPSNVLHLLFGFLLLACQRKAGKANALTIYNNDMVSTFRKADLTSLPPESDNVKPLRITIGGTNRITATHSARHILYSLLSLRGNDLQDLLVNALGLPPTLAIACEIARSEEVHKWLGIQVPAAAFIVINNAEAREGFTALNINTEPDYIPSDADTLRQWDSKLHAKLRAFVQHYKHVPPGWYGMMYDRHDPTQTGKTGSAISTSSNGLKRHATTPVSSLIRPKIPRTMTEHYNDYLAVTGHMQKIDSKRVVAEYTSMAIVEGFKVYVQQVPPFITPRDIIYTHDQALALGVTDDMLAEMLAPLVPTTIELYADFVESVDLFNRGDISTEEKALTHQYTSTSVNLATFAAVVFAASTLGTALYLRRT